MATVLAAVVETVEEATPGMPMQKKWEGNWKRGRDLILCYAAFSRHVGIEFWRGSTLPDPAGLLEGTGKNFRHVKIRSVQDARSKTLRQLIAAAVRLDRTSEPRTR